MDAIAKAVIYQKNQNKLRNAKACITDSLISILDLGEGNNMFRNADYYALRTMRGIDTDKAYFMRAAENLLSNSGIDNRISAALNKAIGYLN